MAEYSDGQLTLSDGFIIFAPGGQLMIDPWVPDTVRDTAGNTVTMLSDEQKHEIANYMVQRWAAWGDVRSHDGGPLRVLGGGW